MICEQRLVILDNAFFAGEALSQMFWQEELALVDLGLPGMDGLELAKRLKAGSATSRIILVALTASVDSADHRAALTAGCVAVQMKPLELECILPLLEKLLKG